MFKSDSASKRILFLTGTRADFGKLKPLIEIVDQTEGLEYRIFATGMHMLARYGSTVYEIEKAGFNNIYTFINQEGAYRGMDLVLANTVQGLGLYIREFLPDMIVVHGDRVETLAGAIVGALNNVLVAHVEGGEISGTVDELLRHAVSKLAHLHFVSNEQARVRLLQMGEVPESVFVIGSPEVDVMLSDRLPPIGDVRSYYQIPFEEYGIFSYHPVTTEIDQLERNVGAVIRALCASGLNYVAIYPNNDTGSEVILNAMRELQDDARFRVIPSMRFEYFLTLLKNARVIVGNSSSGVREAPVFGVPTVDIGRRQMNRYAYESIVNVPEDTSAILDALWSLKTSSPPTYQFGKGDSARRFVEHLQNPQLWATPKQKQFRDMEASSGPVIAS